MYYYAVWVRSNGYRGREPLTYSYEKVLPVGAIVSVPLQRETVIGFIENKVKRPAFATKPLTASYETLPQLPPQTLLLARWLLDYYHSTIGAIATLFLPPAFTAKSLAKLVSEDFASVIIPPQTRLTPQQQAVVKNISKPDTYILQGRTGSGKTRVYIELAQRCLEAGKSVLVLTPEIGLTSQLAASFEAVFKEKVIILHSQLTAAQRLQIWLKLLRTSQPQIVIGPRSILFSPLARIGLIVIDEAHEPAYKQEQSPYYHARPVASRLAQLHNAALLIGSATPALSDIYLAKQRQKPILIMDKLAQASNQPATTVTIVDLKDKTLFPSSRQLSQPLTEAVKAALSRGEQSLIFLNRRGTARVVLCEHCGWQALCPHCDLPLIYHADSGQFRCHTCGYHEPLRTSCPECGQPDVIFRSFGTKAVTDEVQRLFPSARIQRFDTDNTKTERLEQHYEAVRRGDVDILVGTQLLAKGLDLPRLSVIGLLQADSSLGVPDFSAQERTYQLISQSLGRVGRGHVPGHAIIQTYHPDSPVLAAAIANDYSSFYNAELAERRQFHFPPFYYLLKLSTRRAQYATAEAAAEKLKMLITKNITVVEIDGPTPSFHEKFQGKYQVQLVIRSRDRNKLLEVIRLLPGNNWTYDIDPINLL